MKRPNLFPRHQSSRRRAAVAVLTAVTLVVLLIFASFAVDLGFVRAVCGDMQHTADTGALAGASALVATDGKDTEDVKERALDVIERMESTQGFEALDDQIIELGAWNATTGVFTPVNVASGAKAFAVRVVGVRNKTPLFFAGVMGKYSTNVTREAVALASGPCGGIWGLQGVKAGSINTDSYDSSEGPYSALTAGNDGDICSGRDITAGGSFNVHGDVMPGFGYSLTVNGGSGDITGYTTSNSGDLPSVPVDLSYVKYNNDDATIPLTSKGTKAYKSPWNIALGAGVNLTLTGGTYYFDSLKLVGGATLTVSGPTTIYLGGDISDGGQGIINKNQNPHDLTIISAGASVKLGGGGTFYGTLLAPYADVTVGSNAVFYGSLVGKTLTLSGDATVHVDESLPIVRSANAPQPSLVK
jgi:Flp pilus assembly protein TadG